MTQQHTIKLGLSTLAILAGLTGSFLASRSIKSGEILSSGMLHFAESKVVINASVKSFPETETASQISPDGTKNLLMKITTNSDKTKAVEFTAADESGTNAKTIYTTQVGELETFSIPFNAWSPDDKYVFIVKNGNGALVFRADGKPVAKDQTFFDIPAVFGDKVKDNTYKETTGWASNTLLIVNSIKSDGTKGPSYWFEVPSQAIIQLSSQF
jgi:hypothetical protein